MQRSSIVWLLALIFLSTPRSTNSQPTFWGLTTGGGPTGSGVVFKMRSNGTSYSLVHSFQAAEGGGSAIGSQGMVLATNGLFYGTTNRGGASDMGILFSYDADTRVLKKLFDFDASTGGYPLGSLMQSSNGKIYGTTPWEGANGYGTLFEYDIEANTLVVKVNWETGSGMANASFGLAEGAGGVLFGVRGNWGSSRKGLIFSFDPSSGDYLERYHFTDDNNGRTPNGLLTKLDDGTFLGVTESGGTNNNGTIFQFDPTTNTHTKKADIAGLASGSQNGAYPVGFLTKHANGKYYGVTQSGGTIVNNVSFGTIFEYDHGTGTHTLKFSFPSPYGSSPSGKLIAGPDGMLYGKTNQGGGTADQGGTFYSFDPVTNTYTKIIDFGGDYGIKPYGSLELTPAGNILGSTSEGGLTDGGVLFEYNLDNHEMDIVIALNYAPDGASPYGSFVEGLNGKLLATVSTGGQTGHGAVIQLDPATGVITRVLDFSGTNGSRPMGNLTKADNGKYYGMTQNGGANNMGVIFRFDAATLECVSVHDFQFENGVHPVGSLTNVEGNLLFGMTPDGGDNEQGTVFKFNTESNTFTKIHDFTGATGAEPSGSMVLYADGLLYGMTPIGGVNNAGVIYTINPLDDAFERVFDFDPMLGNRPTGDLLVTLNGQMVGLASQGGTADAGVLFQYTPSTGDYEVLKNFDEASGYAPMGSLTEGNSGKVFGMTSSGGDNGFGLVFSFNLSTKAFQKIKSFDKTNGDAPTRNSLYLMKANQQISFTLSNLDFSETAASLIGTSNSSLPVTFQSSDNAIASISGNTLVMHRTGTVTITASQTGNVEFKPATSIDRTISIVLGQPQGVGAQNTSENGFTAIWNTVEGAVSYVLDVSADNFSTYLPGYAQKSLTTTSEAITSLSPNTQYKFRVKAIGEFENSEFSATATVVTTLPPPAPNALAATSVTTSGFTANWEVADGATDYALQVSKDGFQTFVDPYQPKSTSEISELINGLTANTTYQYRVRAVNSGGGSDWSQTITVRTLPDAPIAEEVGILSETSFVATWSGDADTFLLEVSTDGFATMLDGFDPLSTSEKSVEVISLEPGTTYQYRVKAVSMELESGYSNVVETTTPEFVIPGSRSATDITSTNFVANWTIVQAAVGYQLDLSRDNFATLLLSYDGITGNSILLQSLEPNTAYQYRVRAVYPNGISNATQPISVTTTQAAPVLSVASDITQVSFKATWQGTGNAFILEVSADNFATLLNDYDPLETTATTVTVTGLTPGTNYQYRSKSILNGVFSEYSNVATVTTLAKLAQTISFAPIADKDLTEVLFIVSATSDSGLPVALTAKSEGVRVSGSQIEILAAGRAVVEATQAGDEIYLPAASVLQSFCVRPPKPVITSDSGDGVIVLTSNADQGNHWFKDGEPIATTKSINATESGSYSVIVTVDDCSSTSDDFALEITGIGELGRNGTLRVYPNPVTSFIFLEGISDSGAAIRIFSSSGQLALKSEGYDPSGGIDVRSLSAGLYLLEVNGRSRSFVRILKN